MTFMLKSSRDQTQKLTCDVCDEQDAANVYYQDDDGTDWWGCFCVEHMPEEFEYMQ